MSSAPIDLDAARAARAEARAAAGDTPPQFIHHGQTYELPAELPAELMVDMGAIMAGDLTRASAFLAGLLGDNGHLVAELSWPDIEALIDGAVERYGAQAGNSLASASSS